MGWRTKDIDRLASDPRRAFPDMTDLRSAISNPRGLSPPPDPMSQLCKGRQHKSPTITTRDGSGVRRGGDTPEEE